jgi:hypothetical protein
MVLLQLAAAMLLHTPLVAVEGYVTDDATGVPLAGARVELPDANVWSLTDSTGHYVLRAVPGGSQRLRVSRLGYETQALRVVVPSLGTLRLDLALRSAPLRMPIVRVSALALRTPRELAGDVGTGAVHVRRLTSAQLRAHAALAEPDVLGAFASEYDVSIAPESPTAMHVRGGASDQTRLLIDGVPFYNTAHSAGGFGSVNAEALDAVSLHTGARSAAYGSALAGTVVASTKRADSVAVRVRGGITPTTARVTFDGPLVAGRSDFVASARRGAPALFAGRADRTRLTAAFSDWLLKSTTRLHDGSLTLFATSARDRTGFSSRTEYDSLMPGRPNTRHSFDWSGASVAATWQQPLRAGTQYSVTLWRAEFDGDASWMAADPLRMTSGRQTHGLHGALATRTATLGAELQRDRATYDVRDAGGRAQVPAALREHHETSLVLFGDRATSLAALQLRSGARLVFLASGRTLLEPRLAATWPLTSGVAVQGGLARSHQTAQSLRNPESPAAAVFGADLAGLSSGGIPVARSDELTLGVTARASVWRWFLEGYARRMQGLALQPSGSALPFATSLPAAGRGYAHGAGTGAEWRSGRFSGLITLGAAAVRLQPPGDSAYQPAFANTRTLATAATYRVGAQTSLRSALFAYWGRRTTLYDGSLEWEACDVLEGGCEISGTPGDAISARSARRLPPYVRWDVGVRHAWRVRVGPRHMDLEAHATLRNLLDRRNVWGYAAGDGAARALMWRPLSLLTAGLDFHY